MATTITHYGTELTQGPPGNPQTYQPLRVNQLGGRVRFAMFNWVTASEPVGSNIALAKIPGGARLVDIGMSISAGLGSTTLSFGLAGADGTGYIDDGTGANTCGTQTADSVSCISGATGYPPVALAHLLLPTPVAYDTANGAQSGVVTIGGSGGWLYQTAKDVYLTVTVNAATIGTIVLSGYVLYVLD